MLKTEGGRKPVDQVERTNFPLWLLLPSVSNMCARPPILLLLRLVESRCIQVANWILFDCLFNITLLYLDSTLLDDCDCDWIRKFFLSASCSRCLLF